MRGRSVGGADGRRGRHLARGFAAHRRDGSDVVEQTGVERLIGMRVLVTGGAGFIGSNLVRGLTSRGCEVGVIDDLSAGCEENLLPQLFFRRMDILDAGLTDVVAEFAPHTVVHLAAQADVQASIADPERDRAVNVDGTGEVAAAAAAAGATRIISASSAAVYGDPAALPLPETAPKAPANPYGASKLAAETALDDALADSGTDHASFRFSNVYGPRQDWRGEGGVVAIFAGRLAAGEPVTIYGDGRQTRDFIFVGDVVAAIEAALVSASPLAGGVPDGSAYNISTGRETTVEEIASTLGELAGFGMPPEHRSARDGDIERSALDPSKAAAAFGWRASCSLEEGLSATWHYFRGAS